MEEGHQPFSLLIAFSRCCGIISSCATSIADQVIGHVGSTRSGAGAHYLHHQYDDEKKLALETWSEHVVGLIEPK